MKDLSFENYLKKVQNEQDQVLFEDAIKSAEQGMYRAAYILAWLSCVESLKRRFKECSKYGDKKAIKSLEEINNIEKDHKASDSRILTLSKEYNFINDYEYSMLFKHYEMRCVYAHPYEKAPSLENLLSELSDLTDFVLSRPVLFTKNYIDNLLQKLNGDISYLSDLENSVKTYAKQVIKQIHANYYNYLLDNYSRKVESLCADPSLRVFANRAKWFIEELLIHTEYALKSKEEWHDYVSRYPHFSIILAYNNQEFFTHIGDRAQDCLINRILNFATIQPQILSIIKPFLDNKTILRENANKINHFIENMSLESLQISGLEFRYWALAIIKELDSGDFYRQNKTITIIQKYETIINNLPSDVQFKLGELISLAAANNAWEARSYISRIVTQPNSFSFEFLQGVCSVLIEEYPQSRYIYLRASILPQINAMITNLINNVDEMTNYVNKLLSKYIQASVQLENYTVDDIVKEFSLNQYEWFVAPKKV